MTKPFLILLSSFVLSGCVITVNSESSSSPSSLSSSISSSVQDDNLYFDVVSSSLEKEEEDFEGRIVVRIQGLILEEEIVLRGVQLLANTFYTEHLDTIGLTRVNLSISLFNSTDLVTATPTYGVVRYVIHESPSILGIRFLDASLTL